MVYILLKVNLTYFRKNGKYIGEGFYETKYKALYEIWEDIEYMLRNGKRPGLINGHSGYHVLINVPQHEHNHPHLLICAA